MSGFSKSSASSQNSRGTKRKWVQEEDVALVACMVDLYNVETYNADTKFNASYLNELERMLEKVLPHAMLKAKPILFIKKPANVDIVVSLIMTNILPYMQKIEPLGNMLKQLQILLKK
ncbi:hypothetical protein Gotri_001328 [Gossypium trilobum]|uniref:Uncharacterized protein n=1 Tax=Gossypium trilobum TaxID=34281 RepID=A0A7J9FED8_9ROSI|nr:hypothetical protein [Gossypium trilobum]